MGKIYVAPDVKVINVQVEKGFAVSNPEIGGEGEWD